MPKLTASFKALRAISVITVEQMLKPALLMIVIVMVSLYCMTLFLTLSFSNWWLLALLVLLPLTIGLLAAGFMMRLLLKKLMPRELKNFEREQLSDFSNQLFGVIEKSRLPYPVIIFMIAKDVVRKKESSFLRDTIGRSSGLTKEFGEICKLFEK